MDNETLASEMLSQLKDNNKRLFGGLIVVVICWILTIAGFLLFINQYEIAENDSTMTIDADTGEGDNGNINIEDIANGKS